MLLFDSIGPNPKVVRMFIAERGMTGIRTQIIDLMGGENRQAPYLEKIRRASSRPCNSTTAAC